MPVAIRGSSVSGIFKEVVQLKLVETEVVITVR